MNFSRRLIVRKCLLAAFLGVAVLLLGNVFQRLTRQDTEDVLAQLHASRVMTQSLTVNGRVLTADVWRLPETSSAAPLRKSAGKALIVGKTVYLFHGDALSRARMHCTYPEDFPPSQLDCDYVVDTGLMRCVTGRTRELPEKFLGAFTASAQGAGWQPLGGQAWRRGSEVLVAQASEGPSETFVALMIMQEK